MNNHAKLPINKIHVEQAHIKDHQDLVERVAHNLNFAPREQLIAVVTGLAENLVGHTTVVPDADTGLLAAMAVIDERFRGNEWLDTVDSSTES